MEFAFRQFVALAIRNGESRFLGNERLSLAGLPASRLELEITESVLLEKSERNITILNQLRDLGVRISMDDFGTGIPALAIFVVSRSTRSRLINLCPRPTRRRGKPCYCPRHRALA